MSDLDKGYTFEVKQENDIDWPRIAKENDAPMVSVTISKDGKDRTFFAITDSGLRRMRTAAWTPETSITLSMARSRQKEQA